MYAAVRSVLMVIGTDSKLGLRGVRPICSRY